MHVDIDPSFPAELQEYDLVQEDFLGDRNVSVAEWILHGGIPDLNPYLIVDELCAERGPWVLLDGHISQDDTVAHRRRFIFLRGLIVKAEEEKQILEMLEKFRIRWGRLPDIPEGHYIYAGEVPWCDTYPPNEWDDLSFVINTETVVDAIEQPVLLRNGERLSASEVCEFWESISDLIAEERLEDFESTLNQRGLELAIEIVEVEQQDEAYQTFEVLVPVRRSSSHSESAVNPRQSADTPARQIAEHFDLCGQPQTFDLFEKSSRRASIIFRYGDEYHNAQRFTYLRQDLLNRFLDDTGYRLIWAIWGERMYYSPNFGIPKDFNENHPRYKVFSQAIPYSAHRK